MTVKTIANGLPNIQDVGMQVSVPYGAMDRDVVDVLEECQPTMQSNQDSTLTEDCEVGADIASIPITDERSGVHEGDHTFYNVKESVSVFQPRETMPCTFFFAKRAFTETENRLKDIIRVRN
jgi:hypothetical protein